jgi:hypothetical protein
MFRGDEFERQVLAVGGARWRVTDVAVGGHSDGAYMIALAGLFLELIGDAEDNHLHRMHIVPLLQ